MKFSLPTQPNQNQSWDEPVGVCPRLAAALPVNWFRAWGMLVFRNSYPGYTVAAILRRVALLCWVLALSLLSYYVVSRHVISAVVVQGRSMMPTLQDGDRYMLNRLTFHYRSPRRGDLVVIKDPGHQDYAVKRIVALPCESVHLKDGRVYVNGQQLDEPYLDKGTRTYAPDLKDKMIVIGRGQYFVLGDNRPNSEDSRYYGAIRQDCLIGCLSK